jgi:hypothetical protein
MSELHARSTSGRSDCPSSWLVTVAAATAFRHSRTRAGPGSRAHKKPQYATGRCLTYGSHRATGCRTALRLPASLAVQFADRRRGQGSCSSRHSTLSTHPEMAGVPWSIDVDDGKEAAHDAQLRSESGLAIAGHAKPCAAPAGARVLGRFDEAGADENVEVAAEVAIRQMEPSFEVRELRPLGFYQYHQDAETCPLMYHVVERDGRQLGVQASPHIGVSHRASRRSRRQTSTAAARLIEPSVHGVTASPNVILPVEAHGNELGEVVQPVRNAKD